MKNSETNIISLSRLKRLYIPLNSRMLSLLFLALLTTYLYNLKQMTSDIGLDINLKSEHKTVARPKDKAAEDHIRCNIMLFSPTY